MNIDKLNEKINDICNDLNLFITITHIFFSTTDSLSASIGYRINSNAKTYLIQAGFKVDIENNIEFIYDECYYGTYNGFKGSLVDYFTTIHGVNIKFLIDLELIDNLYFENMYEVLKENIISYAINNSYIEFATIKMQAMQAIKDKMESQNISFNEFKNWLLLR